jgi:hypothetical protein
MVVGALLTSGSLASVLVMVAVQYRYTYPMYADVSVSVLWSYIK